MSLENDFGSPMREIDIGAPMCAVTVGLRDSTGGLRNVLAERYYSIPSGPRYTLGCSSVKKAGTQGESPVYLGGGWVGAAYLGGGAWGKKAGTVGLIRDVESILGRRREGWDD